jgi:hypothetical protein
MSLVPYNLVSLAEDDTIGGGKNIVAGAAVNITKATGGAASIFSDEAGTTPISLPTVTDSSGELSFWITAGDYIFTIDGQDYDVIIAGNNILIIDTFADLAATPAEVGQIVITKGHTVEGRGSRQFQAYAGSVTTDGGTKINSATGGVYWAMILNGPLHLDDFGVLGSTSRAGTIDEGALIQKAIDAAQVGMVNKLIGATLYYKTDQTLLITKPIDWEFDRNKGEAFPGAIAATEGALLDWGGGLDPVIFIENVNAGLRMANLTVDGGNAASYCIHADTINYGRFENIWCRYSSIFAFYLDARNGTCSWNTFDRLRCSNGYGGAATASLALAGYEGGYNVCHCTFTNTTIEHARAAHGILLGFADNCTFVDVYTNRGTDAGIPPTGYGVTYSVSGASWAYGNTFYHLQPGNGGYYEPAGVYGGVYCAAQIYGYALDNAAPPAVLDSRSGTIVFYNSNDIVGVKSLGINKGTDLDYPLEVFFDSANGRGTLARYGSSHYIGTYDTISFDLLGCTVNAVGTVRPDNGTAGSGSANFIRREGSTIRGYCLSGLTAGSPVTITDAQQAYHFTESGGGTWTYGFCGVTPSVIASGFGTPTGAARVSSFPGATATLVQTSGALADLIAELKAKGFIGA